MKKRYLILGFSVVLALAVAVPAFGGGSDPTATTSASAKKIAKKAKKKAKQALNKANQALDAANNAQSTADEAIALIQTSGGVPGPQGPAGPQGETGPAGPAGGQGPSPFTQDLLASIDNYGDPDVTLRTNHGFRWFLECEANESRLRVENVSGGDDSGIVKAPNIVNADFDEGEIFNVAVQLGDDDLEASDEVVIYGVNGTTQVGFGAVFDNPSAGFGGDDCVGSLNFLAL